MVQQSFPFRNPLLNYILENAIASLMSKLFRSCKYFYQTKPFCIVENINYLYNDYFEAETENFKFIFEESKDFGKFDNIWVSNYVKLHNGYSKMLLNKIIRCSLVKWPSQILEGFCMNEYRFLKDFNDIRDWNSNDSVVIGEDGDPISLQELVLNLPNATKIKLILIFYFCSN